MISNLPPVRILTTISHIEWLAERLTGEQRIAVDLESDGFYVYHEKTCLLQLSSEKEDFIVDPLAAKDLSPLRHIFADPAIEKVFHAAEYDLLRLRTDFNFSIRGLFDTMAAARTMGSAKLGLAPLIEHHFGVALSKKLQRANWGKRPLSDEQLQYARLDTHFLLRLRDKIEAELIERGLLEEARETFRRLERVVTKPREFDPDDFWRLSGARELTPVGRAVLRELYIFRERTACELDRAAFRVMPEQILAVIAADRPSTREHLQNVLGMTPYLFEHFAEGLLAAIERGLAAEPIDRPPERPAGSRWDAGTARRYELLRAWRKKLADERGVNPVVILETDEVKSLAEAPSKSEDEASWLVSLSDFKRESYGEQLKALLRESLAHQAPPGRKRRRGRR
ncbi:MAG: HRDC domain-containing protein [Elusimicrobiota bacterium]|jgi:ribonuclease D